MVEIQVQYGQLTGKGENIMSDISREDVMKLIENHREYFKTGETRNIDFRLDQLSKLKKAIINNEKAIIEALHSDLGKPEFEAYATEVGYILDSIGFMMKHLKKWARVKKVRTPAVHIGSKSYIYSEPYGTVLIVGPFNYPFQLIFEPLIGALSAGNCAVVKPSRYTPNISNITAKIINETFDERYVSIVEGGRETNEILINSPFDYIFFTGSVTVGRIVMEAAAKNLIPVTLELGGKSPCIVDREARLDVAAKRITWGKFVNVGQTCVAPDYVLVHRDVKDRFIEEMKQCIKTFYGEDPQKSKDYGRIINERHVERLLGLIDREKVVIGGDYDIEDLYISPTIMDNVAWEDKVMEDEIFGPVLPVIEYDNIEETIETINSRPKPLALYVFTENQSLSEKIIGACSFGGGCVNDVITHLATPFLPFGGVGTSGIGSYHGESSFKTFSHNKSVLKKSTGIDLKFLYPPYNSKKVNLLKKVLK